MVVKTDFIRRNDALLRGLSLCTECHVPVDDFSLANLSILRHEKSAKKL